ncbi:MAG TPA: hypothetical protein VG496_00255 [Myxococcales bacterium]|nr:hypothetical protein [Myxococcales bacterium]
MGEIFPATIPSWCIRLAAYALTLAMACSRYSGRPDENFTKARQLYDQLYSTQLDDAYGDPRMDDVVALLGKVHKRSVDAPSAQALLHAIEHGREEFAKARAEHEKFQQAAAEVTPTSSTIDPSRVLQHPDAGPPQDPFGPGASVAEINKEFGGCLVAAEQFRENVTNKSGTLYRLSTNAACKEKLPGFVGQVVMVSEGKVYRRISESEVPRPAASAGTPDGGVAAGRDAGVPAPKPASSANAAGQQAGASGSSSSYPASDTVAAASDGGV